MTPALERYQRALEAVRRADEAAARARREAREAAAALTTEEHLEALRGQRRSA